MDQALSQVMHSQDPHFKVLDYNVIDHRPVQLDLWCYAEKSSPKPVFVYFHGGGLTCMFTHNLLEPILFSNSLIGHT